MGIRVSTSRGYRAGMLGPGDDFSLSVLIPYLESIPHSSQRIDKKGF